MQKRIEQFAPELEHVISIGEQILELASGFGGPRGPAESSISGGSSLWDRIHGRRIRHCATFSSGALSRIRRYNGNRDGYGLHLPGGHAGKVVS